MMSPPRPDDHRRHLRPLAACLVVIACLAGGCAESTSTATPDPAASPTATAPPSSDQGKSAPAEAAIVGAKSDRDGVVAALKEQGIDVVRPKDIVLHAFRYTGLKDPLEWFVEIEKKPLAEGQEGPLRISLAPDRRELGGGTLDLVLLPPTSTGQEGTRVVLRSVPDGGGGGRLVAQDVYPLWFGWPKRTVRVQSRLDGGPLDPKPARTYKLITYVASGEGSSVEISLTLKCRSPKP